MRSRHGPGLRLRLTLLATGLAALISGLLLWLGWLLVGNVVVGALPRLPDETVVRVHGVDVPAERLGEVMRETATERVLLYGGIAFVLVVLAAAVLAWTVSGRVLRPLREVTDTARRLSAESLDQRIELSGPRDEVAELADTFDGMLDRLHTAFAAQRRFVANASHELRTPLSVMRTELDVTMSDPNADVAELRRMAEVVRDASTRSERLVEALLLLARTDGAELAAREPVDLAGVVARAWRAVAEEAKQLELHVRRDYGSAFAMGDVALLERVAGNLLENAVRHNISHGWIEITTTSGQEWAQLRITSSGTGVDPHTVEQLFEPFHRAGAIRTGRAGAGLGLSIVRAVVHAHGGSVHAEPVASGGLSVRVHLPAN